MSRLNRKYWVIYALILLLAAGWKAVLLWMDVFPFNSDEAIVGLMADHILVGNIPVFFYGQAYMGSLDALLVSFLFNIFGQQIILIRVVQSILYLLTIITTVEIGRIGFSSIKSGFFAGILMAVPAVNTTLYTTVSLGGYGETLLIGNLIILFALKMHDLYQDRANRADNIKNVQKNNHKGLLWGWVLLLGVLIGLGFWADGLTLVYSIPVVITLAVFAAKNHWITIKKGIVLPLLALVVGINIGALPCWIFVAQNGFPQLIHELTGSAVDVNQVHFIQAVWGRLVNFMLLGLSAFFGLRPSWQVNWLALPLIPFILIFWGWVIMATSFIMIKASKNRFLDTILTGIIGVLILGFILTPFGNDPSGRYFLPLVVPFMLLASRVIEKCLSQPILRVAVIAGIVLFHFWGTWQCVIQNPPGITTQFDAVTIIDHQKDEALIRFLAENGEYNGYTNYWVAYPLAFKTAEKIIYSPSLPYHQDFRYTSRDNRIKSYSDMADQSEKVAYITTNHPDLDQYLREKFDGAGITWKEQKIGNYQVFYRLSQAVRPWQIGLGENN